MKFKKGDRVKLKRNTSFALPKTFRGVVHHIKHDGIRVTRKDVRSHGWYIFKANELKLVT